MNSYTEPKIYGYKAGEALTDDTNKFVKFGANTDGKNVIKAVAGTDKVIGVLASGDAVSGREVSAGDEVEVALLGGGALIKLAAAVVRGDSLASDVNGEAVVGASGNWCPGIAMQDGAIGDVIEILLDAHYLP